MSKKKKFTRELNELLFEYRKVDPYYVQAALLMEAVYASGQESMVDNVRDTFNALGDVADAAGVTVTMDTH